MFHSGRIHRVGLHPMYQARTDPFHEHLVYCGILNHQRSDIIFVLARQEFYKCFRGL